MANRTTPTGNLLGIDELLQTVDAGASSQTERYSVSRAPDLPFKEMTSQCEALCMGKHQKMSVFMSFSGSRQAAVPGNKIGHTEAIHIPNEQNTNPFLQENYLDDGGMLQAADGSQQQHLLKLPASSPYDNFL